MESDILAQRIFCGYSVKEQKTIDEQIKNQLPEDQLEGRMTRKERVDSFTGSRQQTLHKRQIVPTP